MDRARSQRPHTSRPQPASATSVQIRFSDLPSQVRRAVELCQDRKARQLLVLDLRGLSDATDYFLIGSGDSEVHVRAILEHTVEGLARDGIRPAGIEGERAGRWVLVDYIDLVVHVFHPVVREFYQLERLWGDAPMLLVKEPDT